MEKYKTWLLSAKGRCTRTDYWLGHFLAIAILIVACLIFVGLTTMSNSPTLMYALLIPYCFLIALYVWSSIALNIKRLHDLNMSGWWVLGVVFIPFFVFYVGLAPAKPGPNQYGANPKEV